MPTQQSATPVISSPELRPVVWTTSVDPDTGEPVDSVTEYATDASHLIAALQAIALPPEAKVEATWTYNDTSLDRLTTTLSTNEMANRRWIDFQLERAPEAEWPAGTYEIDVTLNGDQLQHAAILVTESN